MAQRTNFLFMLIALCLAGCRPMASQPGEAATFPPSQTPRPAVFPTRSQMEISTQPPVTPTARQTSTPRRMPSFTAAPTETLPPSAVVTGMYGYGQLLPLSCEARSAADWARYFGIEIHELDFMAHLPKSNNPEQGFVGNPRGGWGLIPPESYGVHAAPIAEVLREYNAQASAVRNLHFDTLRAELAAGRPVMVWVTGHVAPGKRVMYQVNGESVTVARYEHTVIVIGYDKKNVDILDGKTVYKRPIDTFRQSWAVLENMAIIWKEKAYLGRR
jgi:uncharacterized protein YvpB